MGLSNPDPLWATRTSVKPSTIVFLPKTALTVVSEKVTDGMK